jgi:hypothetical protein
MDITASAGGGGGGGSGSGGGVQWLGQSIELLNRGRALLTIELMDGWGLEPAVFDRSMFTKEHQTPNWRRDLWILAVIALATYALGFVCLLLRHRDKQR